MPFGLGDVIFLSAAAAGEVCVAVEGVFWITWKMLGLFPLALACWVSLELSEGLSPFFILSE